MHARAGSVLKSLSALELAALRRRVSAPLQHKDQPNVLHGSEHLSKHRVGAVGVSTNGSGDQYLCVVDTPQCSSTGLLLWNYRPRSFVGCKSTPPLNHNQWLQDLVTRDSRERQTARMICIMMRHRSEGMVA